jgi:peptidoglycan/xylan/chitin deacetylase (PgdA/CDA1 family)
MFAVRLAIVLLLLIGDLFWQPVVLNSGLKTASNPGTGRLEPGTPQHSAGTGTPPIPGGPGHRGASPGQDAHVPALHPPMPAQYRLHRNVGSLLFNSGTPGGPPAPGPHPSVGFSSPLLHLPTVLPAQTYTVPILMYHHVNSLPPPTIGQYGLTVTDQDFTAQLAYLRKAGYHTILLTQLFAAMYEGAKLPPRPIVLTFDDGYLDNYTDALPILRRFHDVADFNIISAYPGITLGVNRYMTWKQLKALVHDGMEIGSHTVDHQDLGQMSEHHARFELRDSRNILQIKLGIPVQVICYPSGEPFANESAAAQAMILNLDSQYGYVFGLLDGLPVTSIQHANQPYQLNRIRVAGGESLQGFIANLPW